jgi:hypothetical protein
MIHADIYQLACLKRTGHRITGDPRKGTSPGGAASNFRFPPTPTSGCPESREVGLREGSLVRGCDRGPFQLIELWVENCFVLELVTAEQLPTSLAFMEPDSDGAWLDDLHSSGPALPAHS